MRRVCFDLACNYYRNPLTGFLNSPSQARSEIGDWVMSHRLEFHAATAFDSAARRFKGFITPLKLLENLQKADEIITFNGRIYDLVVLEKLVGEEATKEIWRKPHHDLCGWKLIYKLENAVAEFLPGIADSFDKVKSDRLAKIRGTIGKEFIADHLADTYRDVKFTCALFRRYLASGDTDRTFHDA